MKSEDLFGVLMSMDSTPTKRNKTSVRAPFGFTGSKDYSLEYILPHLPYRFKYVEPCGGSGSVLIARKESKLEVFNDRYAGVVAFYRCIRDRDKHVALAERLEMSCHSREEFEWCQQSWEDCTDDVERAARWYYVHLLSFNQKDWHFGRVTNSPGMMGRKLHNNIQSFGLVHERFRNVQVENQDWRQCFIDYDSEDCVFYMDPSYWNSAKSYEHEFKYECHVEMCERIQKMRAYIALSGYDNELYNGYEWDAKYEWEVPVKTLGLSFQETAHTAHMRETLKRGTAVECLWVRYVI
jgi:DNA adenine methylase